MPPLWQYLLRLQSKDRRVHLPQRSVLIAPPTQIPLVYAVLAHDRGCEKGAMILP
jgi:hypothetical protein